MAEAFRVESKDKHNSFLDCDVCLEPVNNHRVLPCQHSFCHACLEPLVTNDVITCPVCREVCPLTDNGVSGLPRNVFLVRYLEQRCEKCKVKTKETQCEHCDKQLCSVCHQFCKDEVNEFKDDLCEDTKHVLSKANARLHQIQNDVINVHDQISTIGNQIDQSTKEIIDSALTRQRQLKRDLHEQGNTQIKRLNTDYRELSDKISKLKLVRKNSKTATNESVKDVHDMCIKLNEESTDVNRASQSTDMVTISYIDNTIQIANDISTDGQLSFIHSGTPSENTDLATSGQHGVAKQATPASIVHPEDKQSESEPPQAALPGVTGNIITDKYQSRPESVFQLTINNISTFSNRKYSLPHYIRGIPWKIMAEPRYDANNEKHLAIFMVCSIDSQSLPSSTRGGIHDIGSGRFLRGRGRCRGGRQGRGQNRSWSCQASAELRLLAHKPHTESLSRKVEHLFNNEDADWGFKHFISWAELVEQSRGFVEDDSITLEIYAKANQPTFFRKNDKFMTIHIVLDEDMRKHHGFELFDHTNTQPRNYKVNGSCTVEELSEILSGTLNCRLDQLRIWPFCTRSNQTFRPTCIDMDEDFSKTIKAAAYNEKPWTIYVEMLDLNSSANKLPTFNCDSDVLLFLKMYDPKTKTILYCGHIYMPIASKIGDFLLPVLCTRAGFPQHTEILLFEEVKPNQVKEIESFDKPLEQVVDELLDGDLFVFQKNDLHLHSYDVPTAKEYLKMLKTNKQK